MNSTQRKNLVFTSAGDRTSFFRHWLSNGGEDARTFDLCVCYYGDKQDSPWAQYADHYFERKGSKFQNFHALWVSKPEVFAPYERFFIVDDDIILSGSDIEKLFRVHEEYNLDILQPSFIDGDSKISHKITRQVRKYKLRFTDFVEVNTMLFARSALETCMERYDPRLVGWGVDFMFIWILGRERKNKYAVVDAVGCINPKADEHNGEVRLIDQLQSTNDRMNTWTLVSKEIGMPVAYWMPRVYSAIV